MLGVALPWLVGTLALHALPALPGLGWSVPLALAALVAITALAGAAGSKRLGAAALAALCAFVYTAWHAHARLAERLPLAALNGDFAITGYVDAFPSTAPGQTTLSLTVTGARPEGVSPRVRVTWYDPPDGLVPGAAVDVVARLRPPRGARNPGGFDYERWLMLSGYGATGYVRSGAIVQDAGGAKSFRQRWLAYRHGLAQRLEAAAPDADAAALLTALAIGERHLFTDTHWDDFRRTGTSHLVAVSGMHVALLGLCAFVAVRFLWLRLPAPLVFYDLEAAALAAAAATVYYAALTGFAVPAQRSLIMVVVALAVVASRRRTKPAAIFGAALLAVLLWDPFAPLTASFWLSFGAVAVLIAIGAPRVCAPRPRGLAGVVPLAGAFTRLQWAIGFALVPLTAAFFDEISLAGPFVNLVAIPFFNLVLVPATLAATVLASFDLTAALVAPVVAVAGALASATVAVLHAVAGLPAAALPMPVASPWVAWVGVAGVLLAASGVPLPRRRLGWLALVPLFAPFAARLPHGAAKLVVLDVGHGLAVIVETRSHRLLFDAGPTFRSGFDSGADVVVPALRATSTLGLDRLIVSHGDNDHAGGAPAVAAAFPRAALAHGPDYTAQGGTVCTRGERWEWDGVTFAIVHPPQGFAGSANDTSCVLRIATAGGAALLTGDVEARGESRMLDARAELSAQVVVVPHHGSATSSTPSFVSAVGARYALVSAGYANRWGFPRPDVRARWEQAGAEIRVTGDDGALTVMLGTRDGDVALGAERDARHHYWQTSAK